METRVKEALQTALEHTNHGEVSYSIRAALQYLEMVDSIDRWRTENKVNIKEALQTALEHAEDDDVSYSIRAALQYLEMVKPVDRP